MVPTGHPLTFPLFFSLMGLELPEQLHETLSSWYSSKRDCSCVAAQVSSSAHSCPKLKFGYRFISSPNQIRASKWVRNHSSLIFNFFISSEVKNSDLKSCSASNFWLRCSWETEGCRLRHLTWLSPCPSGVLLKFLLVYMSETFEDNALQSEPLSELLCPYVQDFKTMAALLWAI